jgi:hypothetical protein
MEVEVVILNYKPNIHFMSAEEQKVPTKEEVVSFLKEQIEVKKIQLELQKLNTELATARAEEYRAMAFIAQMTTDPEEKKLDEEDEEQPQSGRTLKKVK